MHSIHQRSRKNTGREPLGLSRRDPGSGGAASLKTSKFHWRAALLIGLGLLLISLMEWSPTAAQTTDTTATPNASGAYITVTYIEPINVRAGPSSFDYPVIGSIPVGGTAPAIGRSPASEWIEISFPDGPHGVGWVYAANVRLSTGALLPVVEAPPTAVPATTPTVNPTFVAALQPLPTSTRKPTFTAPPPLEITTFANPPDTTSGHFQMGWIVVGLGLVGLLGMAISSLRRR